MEELLLLRQKLVELQDNIIPLLKLTFEDLAIKIEQLNIEQLQRGERADGTPLPFYSPVSVAVYGKPAGRIKLFDTGEFYMGITVVINDDGIEIVGRDIKTEMLQIRYGENIVGLSEESMDILIDRYAIQLLSKYIQQYLLQ